jgi:hypothetical protein
MDPTDCDKRTKFIQEEAFSWHSIRCMSNVNIVRKWVGTILSDGINKFFFVWFFMVSVWELNYHTVYKCGFLL